eukprot:817798-Pelagomonas_calceolata.AAC.1
MADPSGVHDLRVPAVLLPGQLATRSCGYRWGQRRAWRPPLFHTSTAAATPLCRITILSVDVNLWGRLLRRRATSHAAAVLGAAAGAAAGALLCRVWQSFQGCVLLHAVRARRWEAYLRPLLAHSVWSYHLMGLRCPTAGLLLAHSV